MEEPMYPGEIAVLALIIAAFVVFGVTLAWMSRRDGADHAVQQRRFAEDAGASTAHSYQGADG
jgi:hypothetical protein